MANGDEHRKPSWSSWFAPGDVRHTPTQDEDAKRPAPVALPSQAQETSKTESNPLIAFKHFVDDAFSAIIRDLREATRDKRIAQREEPERAYMRWTGAKNTDHLEPLGGRIGIGVQLTKEQIMSGWPLAKDASATAKMIFLESERRNRHVDPSLITALYEDPECISWFEDTRWLSVPWFKDSPYSPFNLEADSALAKYDTKWRNAFEDLLEAALDKPITSREKFGYRSQKGPISTWRGPGLDWMLSLQCRGILPPQLPSMYSKGHTTSQFLADIGLPHGLLGRWRQQHSAPFLEFPSSLELPNPVRMALNNEWIQLLFELSTPVFGASTSTREQPEALGTTFPPVTYGSAMNEDEYEFCPRAQIQPMTEESTTQDSASTGRCPDELGHAVSEALRLSREPDSELDIYEQMYNDWLQDSARETGESEHPEQERIISAAGRDYAMQVELMKQQQRDTEQPIHTSVGRCPDDLGCEIGDFARQEAARAFADEENGLTDYERETRCIERVEQRRLERLKTEQALRDFDASRSDESRLAVNDIAQPWVPSSRTKADSLSTRSLLFRATSCEWTSSLAHQVVWTSMKFAPRRAGRS
jgi:hypothetical protein